MAKISVLHLGGDNIEISKNFVFLHSNKKVHWDIVSVDPEASSAEILFFNSSAVYFQDGNGNPLKSKNEKFNQSMRTKISGNVPKLGYTGVQVQKYDVIIYKWAIPGNPSSGEVVAAQLDPVIVVEDP